jgi:Rps23 Pro-64 3,4-dihydroxylase Tpa1-like proline 4-hydroxylase
MQATEPSHPQRERLIDLGRFESCVEALGRQYAQSLPWRHLVVDNFLHIEAAHRAAAAFPALPPTTLRLASLLGARSHEGRLGELDPIFDEIFEELHSPRLTSLVERITGIDDLLPDGTLSGAGLHQGGRGSYLRLHADHNTHPSNPNGYRRVNIMIYLNPRWEPSWNGALQLWDRDGAACRVRIEPIFNRCVIMSVDDTAYHAYGPLRVPKGSTRNALATYYYTEAPAEGQELKPHHTVWPKIPGTYPLEPVVHRARMYLLSRLR